ncbi:YeiH family protein [Poseidonibacter lekithochrous]|uniref:YeiH family protein n=1 Tax=Poseidonibacter lekithochrous TaxID=1904463 RepID=UPI0008FCAD63|nr:YeiH family protein [Poseidonibacter lekithochrous]QKJ24129.1 YeiH/YadS family membrane protein [Poseidonibacter lekithochrous]
MDKIIKNSGLINGLLFVGLFAFISVMISKIEIFKAYHISPLIIGIILGILFSHTFRSKLPEEWKEGIIFSTKTLLRIAIVFYGFRLTFQDITDIGIAGVVSSFLIVTLTFIVGMFVGTKILKLDKETTILTSAGSSICGAAAVLATESVIKAPAHKSAIAVGTVVLFGTISMFLYPYLYKLGFYSFNEQEFGIYLGATLHEVAHVVAAGNSISEEVANFSVIEKMLRVMFLAPFLIIISFYITRVAKSSKSQSEKAKIVIPWFAFMFIGVAIFNSFDIFSTQTVTVINEIDTFFLTMAMSALGMETHYNKFKNVGMKPIYLATILFVWLMFSGIAITFFSLSL